jgi:hypothetical protein
MAGENKFRLRLVSGRRRFALSPPEHFKSEMLWCTESEIPLGISERAQAEKRAFRLAHAADGGAPSSGGASRPPRRVFACYLPGKRFLFPIPACAGP